MKRFSLLALLGIAALGLAAAAPSGRAQGARSLDIYWIDVEGGASTLIVTPAGESILVDSGWPGLGDRDPKRIAHVAKDVAGLTQIDHYVTTHWHTDHYGGIEGVNRLIPVRHFYDRGIPDASQADSQDFPELIAAYRKASGGHSTTLKPGDSIRLRNAGQPVSLKCLSASGKVIGEGDVPFATSCDKHPGMDPDPSDNAKSVSLLLSSGNFQFLDCGDLTWNIEHKLVCPTNRIGKVDVFQVTHHGMDISNNPALLEAIEPAVAVMDNGPRKGGSAATVKRLKALKSLEALYQLHRNVTTGPDDNTSPDKIANMDENCQGEFLHARLSADGSSYTITKGAGTVLGTHRVR